MRKKKKVGSLSDPAVFPIYHFRKRPNIPNMESVSRCNASCYKTVFFYKPNIIPTSFENKRACLTLEKVDTKST